VIRTLCAAARVLRAAAAVMAVALLAAVPALADHPGPFRTEGMSPLTSALLTGALAFVVALLVVVVVMLLTRSKPDEPKRDEP
jgi:hypothetical protein